MHVKALKDGKSQHKVVGAFLSYSGRFKPMSKTEATKIKILNKINKKVADLGMP